MFKSFPIFLPEELIDGRCRGFYMDALYNLQSGRVSAPSPPFLFLSHAWVKPNTLTVISMSLLDWPPAGGRLCCATMRYQPQNFQEWVCLLSVLILPPFSKRPHLKFQFFLLWFLFLPPKHNVLSLPPKSEHRLWGGVLGCDFPWSISS